jgi:hypothetical protein
MFIGSVSFRRIGHSRRDILIVPEIPGIGPSKIVFLCNGLGTISVMWTDMQGNIIPNQLGPFEATRFGTIFNQWLPAQPVPWNFNNPAEPTLPLHWIFKVEILADEGFHFMYQKRNKRGLPVGPPRHFRIILLKTQIQTSSQALHLL